MALLFMASQAWAQPAPQFTAKEKAWIKQNPVVRIAVEPDWRPLEYLEHGQPAGLSAEYLKAVSRLSGLRFEVVPDIGWNGMERAIRTREVDLFPSISPQFSMVQQELLITKPYFAGSFAIVTRDNEEIIFDSDRLFGKVVAIKGGGAIEYALATRYPQIKLVTASSTEEALALVADGTAEAAVGLDTTLLPIMRRKFYGRLFVSGTLPEMPAQVAMGIRKDLPILASIVEKSLNSVTARESNEMIATWLDKASYGEPTPQTVLRYYAPYLALVGAAIIALALLVYFALRAKKAALRSEQDKAMFLAIMGHEIRTPVHAILSSVELLAHTKLSEHQAQLSKVATTASESLIALLNDVLEFSRLETREIQLDPVPTAVGPWIRETLELKRWRAEAKGLTLVLEIQCDEDKVLEFDPHRLQQVVLNLLSNAIKFTQKGTVRLRLFYAGSQQGDNGKLTIEVHDTGIGIAPHNQAHIFDAFRQETRETSRRFGGTGLGLAICREIVTLMQGTIGVRSKPGVFTVFTVNIPVRSASAEEAVPTLGPSRERGRTQDDIALADGGRDDHIQGTGDNMILVVDDDELARFTIGQQLASLGLSAAFSSSGSEALERVATRRYDMILLDCDLPDLDGYTVAERVRDSERRAGYHTPIIAISASSDQAHQARCFSSGMDGVLSKPLRLKSLRNMINLWCGTNIREADLELSEKKKTTNMVDTQNMFAKAVEADLVLIEKSLRVQDWVYARHAAHRIKGAALVMGHQDTAAIAAEVERMLAANRKSNIEAVRQHIATLKDHSSRFSSAAARSAAERGYYDL